MMLACALAVPAALQAQHASAVPARDTVLFICEHGTVRSLIAKLLFERYASELGLRMAAVSRGTAIDSVVPPWLRTALTADQFALGSWRPQTLRVRDVQSARYVVSFDLPVAVSAAARGSRAQWNDLPSVTSDYITGRDAIASRVRQLVDSLYQSNSQRRK